MPATEMTRTHGYAPVNGLNMYYEIEGTDQPIILSRPPLDSPA